MPRAACDAACQDERCAETMPHMLIQICLAEMQGITVPPMDMVSSSRMYNILDLWSACKAVI